MNMFFYFYLLAIVQDASVLTDCGNNTAPKNPSLEPWIRRSNHRDPSGRKWCGGRQYYWPHTWHCTRPTPTRWPVSPFPRCTPPSPRPTRGPGRRRPNGKVSPRNSRNTTEMPNRLVRIEPCRDNLDDHRWSTTFPTFEIFYSSRPVANIFLLLYYSFVQKLRTAKVDETLILSQMSGKFQTTPAIDV